MLALLLLHACGTTPPAPEQAAALPPVTTPAPPPRASSLAVERQWLQSWFKGTPVRILQLADGAMSVEVPLEFCFDPGQSKVKPPLAAVLDKVSQSLSRTPQARLEWLAAPGDGAGAGASPLAQQRAAQVRKHLRGRGVPASQLGTPSVSTDAAVQLRMTLAAP